MIVNEALGAKGPPLVGEEVCKEVSGGALYIMFDDHVRLWPLLKTPLHTRGYMSKYLCI